jgi:hypothetical protein
MTLTDRDRALVLALKALRLVLADSIRPKPGVASVPPPESGAGMLIGEIDAFLRMVEMVEDHDARHPRT